jgi:hypothetical protein
MTFTPVADHYVFIVGRMHQVGRQSAILNVTTKARSPSTCLLY